YWYIEDQVVFDVVPDSDVAFEGGAAIGSFQGMLTDLDASLISDSIPGFHDLQFRIGQFREAMEHGDNERIEYSSSLAEKIMHHQVDMLHVYERSRLNNLPVRITHNDAKFNNILFHNSKSADNPGFKANCLIDLDTVMKGYAWFDFGDALRTAGSTASEDEKRLRAIDFRLDIFEGFTKGYFQKGRDFLTNDEVELMHRAPAVFAYNQSMRFLTDYMTNDKYYKTNSKDHNYHRAMAQFRLMEKILEKQQVMKKIVDSTVE
ncbi:MAG TPA: phosphotransferase, partial [Bacteroidales bacterium]|nr:phosphotransferase [Bacteroidales bacterium]